jgi:hypothetical protein
LIEINSGQSLIINGEFTVGVNGSIQNIAGTFNNNGATINLGFIGNTGSIELHTGSFFKNNGDMFNGGSIANYFESIFMNNGYFANNGTLKNFGNFTNVGIFSNYQNFTNNGITINQGNVTNAGTGTITNQNGGKISNQAILVNVGYIYNYGTLHNTFSGFIYGTSGTIHGFGDFINDGTYFPGGTSLHIHEGGRLVNELIGKIHDGRIFNNVGGELINKGQIGNTIELINDGTIRNTGDLLSNTYNNGLLYTSIPTGGTITGNPQIVLYYAGWFQPVDNIKMNRVKAGSAVPHKFSLGGNKGLDIFFSDPTSHVIDCDSNIPIDNIEETVPAVSSRLSYDVYTDQYNYVWKTESSWAGTCRQLVVTLNDGSVHTANFKFR